MIRRSGFTLIELLVVMAVIATLMGLLMVALRHLRFNAAMLRTTQRMEAVLAGIARVGQQDGSTAQAVQRDAGLGGVLVFRSDPADPQPLLPLPRVGDTFADASLKSHFAFPWNQEDLLGTLDPITGAGSSSDPDAVKIQDPATGRWRFVSSVTLSELDPLRTERLLALAGILPVDDPVTPANESEVAYRGDRSAGADWNDAWGNPLVVAYGLFQPVTRAGVVASLERYQYSRSVYLSVASMGLRGHAFSLGSDWQQNMRNIWNHANTVCQADGVPWDQAAFTAAPWQGVKSGSRVFPPDDTQYRAFLSAPREYK